MARPVSSLPASEPDDHLRRTVFDGTRDKPFGEFTAADARTRARELREVTGWGPTARVGAVARGWSELADALAAAGAGTVAELDPQSTTAFARRLWITPPSLL